MRALLAAGADPNARNTYGDSPLVTAVYSSQGRGEIITALRAAGADPVQGNNHGQTPVGLARLIDNDGVVQYFTDVPEIG